MRPGLDLLYTDPAQHLKTTGLDLNVLDRGLSDRRVKPTQQVYVLSLIHI